MRNTTRPNILWTVSEDCPPRFGCYGDRLATTPNIDALSRRGVLFEHAYSAAPVCALARFALITGIAPQAHAPANHMRAEAPRPAWMRTYPEILREAGYYCTNNAKTDYNAAIDEHLIWDDSSRKAHWRNRPSGAPFCAVFNLDVTHESSIFGDEDPDVDPALIVLPAYLPDTPEIRADFARHYLRIAAMDAAFGRLIDQLEADGLADSTVVIHSSDHGGVTPRTKRYCYDGGLHVPLIIAAPPLFADRFVASPSRVTAAVSTIDLFATLLTLAGADVPERTHSRSLTDRRFDDSDYAFGARNRMDERYDMIRTVCDARFRYVANFTPHRPLGQHQAFAWLAQGYQSLEREHLAGRLDAVQERFFAPKDRVELYDTVLDPDQVHNLAGDPDYAAVQARLHDALLGHLRAVHDNGFLPEGAAAQGWDASRVPGAYPLDALVELGEAILRGDSSELDRFVAALNSADATIRRWATIGILALDEHHRGAEERLESLVHTEPDPFVLIPACETLARHYDNDVAIGRLGQFVLADHPRPVRLESLSALGAIEPARLHAIADVISAAASDPDQYVGESARWLEHRIHGTYRPELVLFDWHVILGTSRPQAQ